MNLKPYLRIDNQISLHLARPELAEAIFEAIDQNRGHLRPWLPWVDGTRSVDDTKTFIQESMKHNSEGTRLTTFIIYEGEFAGALGVVSFAKEHHRCEIGYWLRASLQGRGIVTRALVGFSGFLLKSKALNRLEVHVAPENTRSRAVPLRAGYRSEGIHRQSMYMHGQYYDVEIFSLLKGDLTAVDDV